MTFRAAFTSLLLALPIGATAQEDPMELQRCVWMCLSQFGPADNPAYDQCVTDVCVAEAPVARQSRPTPDRGAGWTYGTLNDGTRYAGIDSRNGRRGVYYFCDGAGRSDLMIAGVPERAGAWALVIDGMTYSFAFTPTDNGITTTVRRNDPVLRALRSGSTVSLVGAGGSGPTLTLTGSKVALGRTRRACRN